jgi:hypothetical protein
MLKEHTDIYMIGISSECLGCGSLVNRKVVDRWKIESQCTHLQTRRLVVFADSAANIGMKLLDPFLWSTSPFDDDGAYNQGSVWFCFGAIAVSRFGHNHNLRVESSTLGNPAAI